MIWARDKVLRKEVFEATCACELKHETTYLEMLLTHLYPTSQPNKRGMWPFKKVCMPGFTSSDWGRIELHNEVRKSSIPGKAWKSELRTKQSGWRSWKDSEKGMKRIKYISPCHEHEVDKKKLAKLDENAGIHFRSKGPHHERWRREIKI